MAIWAAVLGGAIVIGTIVECLISVLSVSTEGLVTYFVGYCLRTVILSLQKISKNRLHWLMAFVGVGSLIFVVFAWVLFIWIGWTLVFSGGDSWIINVTSGKPADTLELIYFAGNCIFTLGLGDFVPHGGFPSIMATLAAFNGFFFVGLIATYLLSVVTAYESARKIAAYLISLGDTPFDILQNSWNGKNWGSLQDHLVPICQLISGQHQIYTTYPVIISYHTTDRHNATGLRIAALGELTCIIECGISLDQTPVDKLTIIAISRSVALFTETIMKRIYSKEVRNPPPIPDISVLINNGLPMLDKKSFEAAMNMPDIVAKRMKLLNLVEMSGWRWEDVYEK